MDVEGRSSDQEVIGHMPLLELETRIICESPRKGNNRRRTYVATVRLHSSTYFRHSTAFEKTWRGFARLDCYEIEIVKRRMQLQERRLAI